MHTPLISGLSSSLHGDLLTPPTFGFLPSELANLELWTRFNQGITVTGSGVSQWDDQSGNGNHLKQGTDADRPSKELDGSILFDGVDHFLRADAFTFEQPETIYILCKLITWTAFDRLFDGSTSNAGSIQQATATPQLRLSAGLVIGNVSLALDTYGVLTGVFNGASSVLQLNNDAPVTGNVGTNDLSGFTLGASGDASPVSATNMQVKEVIGFSAAHDAATRAKVISYLSGVGGL